ncbi:phospholipase D-like domain-containing protein [Dongshaea marina]|uniref:phospholipase D-like domain-containing protein n=1 Tax=Dongshaea marina TaxID=2047966 RepID=UPI000D3E55FE|nr:phospholipase D-like domain-containing protein [Dongshaea marina]
MLSLKKLSVLLLLFLTSLPVFAKQTLFVEPQAMQEPILNLIHQSRRQIDVVIYQFTDPVLIQALGQAEQRGVKVRVLFTSRTHGDYSSVTAAIKSFRDEGVEVKTSNPDFTYTHQKTFIFDDQQALISTGNMTFDHYPNTRNFMVLTDEREQVKQIAAVFEKDWLHQLPSLSPEALSRSQLVWSPINADSSLVRLIDSASSSLDIYALEMTDPDVVSALYRALDRGVRVTIIVSKDPFSWSRDCLLSLYDQGAKLQILGDDSPFIHAKAILADSHRAFIGSENFTSNSLNKNRELGIITADPGVIETLASTLKQDMAAPHYPVSELVSGQQPMALN